MVKLVVQPARAPLRGSLPAPPDAVVAELALLLGALADGASVLRGRGLPALPMEDALGQLGVRVIRSRTELRVEGVGRDGLQTPRRALDCGGSRACLAALAGLLAAQPFESELSGDDAVMRASLPAVARALRWRGANIEGRLDPARPRAIESPVRIVPAHLSPLAYELGPGDWPAKIAALVSGLHVDGETVISEAVPGDDRAERLFSELGLPLASAGPHLRLRGPVTMPAIDATLPGDGALGAALLLAGMAVPESDVAVREMGLSRARRGWIDAALHAGARLSIEPRSERCGTPVADVRLRGARASRALLVADEVRLRAGAALATMASMAAVAPPAGAVSQIDIGDHDAAPVLGMLESFGVAARTLGSSIEVRARELPLRAAVVRSGDDADVAMAAAALALSAEGPCVVEQAAAIVGCFPRFVTSLRALGAVIDVEP